jgi:hypothetical protein
MSLFDDLDVMAQMVNIYLPTVTQDASGGDDITFTTLRAANVPCLICAGQASERDEFSQAQRPRVSHSIAFGVNGDGGVQPGDQLVDCNTGAIYRFTGEKSQQTVGGIDAFSFITVTQLD